jgi:hypothetical protein
VVFRVAVIGGGSDFLFFLQRIGVPCVDLRFAPKVKLNNLYKIFYRLVTSENEKICKMNIQQLFLKLTEIYASILQTSQEH